MEDYSCRAGHAQTYARGDSIKLESLNQEPPYFSSGGMSMDIKKLQRELKASQFDPGPVDGILGPWTKKALMYRDENPFLGKAITDRITLLQNSLSLVGKLSKSEVGKLVGSVEKNSTWRYNCAFIHRVGKDFLIPKVNFSSQLLDRPTWTSFLSGATPQAGDIFGTYLLSLNRIGHCGIILEWDKNEKYFLSIEAIHNDNYRPGGRDGGWPTIAMKRRLKTDVASVKRFLT